MRGGRERGRWGGEERSEGVGGGGRGEKGGGEGRRRGGKGGKKGG
ncbi:hypothetical protein [Escherichia coli]|nr:hypothetical protein [Escherichia coli]